MGIARVLGVSVCPGRCIHAVEAEQFLQYIRWAKGYCAPIDTEFAFYPNRFLPREKTVRLLAASLDPEVDASLRDTQRVEIATEELRRLSVPKNRIKDVCIQPCCGFILPLNTSGRALIISAKVRDEKGAWEEQSIGLTNFSSVEGWVRKKYSP